MTNLFRRKATLVIVLAVVVRLAFAIAVDNGVVDTLPNPDAADYLSFGYNLATGVGFARALNEHQPFSQPVEFSAYRPPLYPAFLAIAFQVSRGTLFLQSLQTGLTALALYFFLRLGFVLFGETPALIAGLAFALYPPLIMYAADLGTESLFLFLLLLLLFVFYSAEGEHSLARVFGLGVLVGLAALCRPNGLMLAPALVVAIWLTAGHWKRATLRIGVLTIAVAVTILPWTYRNYRLFHKVVLITTNGGQNFWAGAHMHLEPGATLADLGYSQHVAFRDVPEPERDQYYYRQAFAILDHSPRRFGEMFVANFAGMYALVPSGLYHSLRARMGYAFSFVPLLLSGLAGWVMIRRRWRELSLLWAWVITSTVMYCAFIGAPRYRVGTVDPILMLGAGMCLAALLGRYRPSRQC